MSYNFNSFINQGEADALKEMIFKRANERAKMYSDDVHAEIMDLARETFVSNGNPFSKIIEQETINKKNIQATSVTKSEPTEANEEIGFPQKPIRERLKAIRQKTNISNELLIQHTINNSMSEARASLSNNKSFMGALNFLNSQAAVSLLKTRADRFEVIS